MARNTSRSPATALNHTDNMGSSDSNRHTHTATSMPGGSRSFRQSYETYERPLFKTLNSYFLSQSACGAPIDEDLRNRWYFVILKARQRAFHGWPPLEDEFEDLPGAPPYNAVSPPPPAYDTIPRRPPTPPTPPSPPSPPTPQIPQISSTPQIPLTPPPAYEILQPQIVPLIRPHSPDDQPRESKRRRINSPSPRASSPDFVEYAFEPWETQSMRRARTSL